jgi:hypothetical protein
MSCLSNERNKLQGRENVRIFRGEANFEKKKDSWGKKKKKAPQQESDGKKKIKENFIS